MDACPAEDRLVALLDEALTPGEFRAIEDHVAGCASCQAALERLNAFTWGELRLPEGHAGGTPSPAGPRPEIPGYEIREELGRGGHGVVFRAIDLRLDRAVALKMIRHGALASDVECRRFLAEARAAARIRHPHIIPIYAVGEHAGQPFFTMELAAGGSLDRRLARGPADVREAARLVERLARAVQHAHERGVVHRDLKPANILLADATLDEPRIADFGIARIDDAPPGRTPSGVPFGTPGYMAPEQAEGRPDRAGATVDVFSLGAILYVLLAGRPPFGGRTSFATLLQAREREPTPPSRLRPGLPRAPEAICLKCLRKRPEERYQAASELADDLHRFLDGEAVRALADLGGTEGVPAGGKLARRASLAAFAALVLLLVSAWAARSIPRRGDAPAADVVRRIRLATPAEIPTLRAELRPERPADADRLWRLLDDLLSARDPGAFAAAAVLAGLAPDDARWASRARPLADRLIADEPDRRAWTDRLRPVPVPLIGVLGDRLAGQADDRDARGRAARLLLDLAASDPRAASLLADRLGWLADPAPGATVVERAKSAGNLGAALILAGDDRFARPLLLRSSSPTARTCLIASLGADCGDLRGLLLDRAVREPDPGARQALLLALGRAGPPPAEESGPDREATTRELIRLYREDLDAGVHGAAEWALRRWGLLNRIRLERNLLAEARPRGGSAGDRGWYVGPHRHTLAVLRPPAARAFAIATHEVSALQLEEFLRLHSGYRPRRVRDGHPACPVPLFMARAYCNWLSVQEGLAGELCYEPGPGDSYEPVEGYLERRGYRLPTEEEWRFACSGDAATPFPHGHGEEFFADYGLASATAPQNVGRLLPNDRGLFDMLGNACEWCERPGAGSATACGGSYLLPPLAAPAVGTDPNVHPEAGRTVGFRVARTWR